MQPILEDIEATYRSLERTLDKSDRKLEQFYTTVFREMIRMRNTREKSPTIKGYEAYYGGISDILYLIMKVFSENAGSRYKEGIKKRFEAPETRRREELQLAYDILNNITLREMIIYYKATIEHGLEEANNIYSKWLNKIRVRKVIPE
ncbi:hypothetical protein KAU18_01830 [Candidatus Bathyarchaeota archaeon]|nr:hypothetical protein [Candidatus Bathyarchaeota archaeon]